MAQEQLAEKLGVSRQTVSKWELDLAYPEMNKLIELCNLFSCSLDELVREELNVSEEAYSDIWLETVPAFSYLPYAVISREPEDDAFAHVTRWAEKLAIQEPTLIGWDFPVLSQEQINVHHLHGYTAALILPEDLPLLPGMERMRQGEHCYLAITIREPMKAPFRLIPRAYQLLMRHLSVNGMRPLEREGVLPCFEKEYRRDGVHYMDVYVTVE